MAEDHDIEVGKIQKNATEEIHVLARRYKGYRFIDLRIRAQNNAGEMVPTVKGLAVKPEDAGALINLIQEAAQKIEELG
ncbi:transcriptional coactivator p15/PC4 family protein [bacterium]|nr:transcriptional coactivator p15/PC4 family protein [bacterium]